MRHRPKSKDGLGFAIRADPSDRQPIENLRSSWPLHQRVHRSRGMAMEQRCKPSEGCPLQRSAPSVGRFWGRIRPWEPFPDWRTSSPASPSARAADASGNWDRQLREMCFPSYFTPFSVVFHSLSMLLSTSCLEIRVRDPNFKARPLPPRAHSCRSGLF